MTNDERISFNNVRKIVERSKISLTFVEQDELIVKYQTTGDVEFRNKAINSILGYVMRFSVYYSRKTKADMYSLFMEGYYGALWSADRFDMTKNVSFMKFSEQYIKKYMCAYLEKEYVDGFGMASSCINKLRKNVKEGSEEKLSQISQATSKDGERFDIFDTLTCNNESVEDILNQVEVKETVERMIDNLADFEKDVFLTIQNKTETMRTMIKRVKKEHKTIKNNYINTLSYLQTEAKRLKLDIV